MSEFDELALELIPQQYTLSSDAITQKLEYPYDIFSLFIIIIFNNYNLTAIFKRTI